MTAWKIKKGEDYSIFMDIMEAKLDFCSLWWVRGIDSIDKWLYFVEYGTLEGYSV